MKLRKAWTAGYRAALEKFALNPPTQVDEFLANVENGKDAPHDPTMDKLDAPALPQDQGAEMGQATGSTVPC